MCEKHETEKLNEGKNVMGIFMIFKLNAIINSDGFQYCFDEMWKCSIFFCYMLSTPFWASIGNDFFTKGKTFKIHFECIYFQLQNPENTET